MNNVTVLLLGWQIHLIVGFVIFFVVNWIGKHSTQIGYDFLNSVTEPENAPGFNLIFRIFTPVVVLILISAGLYAAGFDEKTENIHRAIFYYITIRVIFNILIRQRGCLAPWGRMIFQWCATITLGNVVYRYVISEREYLFPDVDTLGNEIWLLLIGYGYILAKSAGNTDGNRSQRVSKYIETKLKSFIEKYDQTITSLESNTTLISLVYSIMVVEDFNRPKPYRILERILFPFGCVKTLGLMQVSTTRQISDSESVSEGLRIIRSLLNQIVQESDWKVNQTRRRHLSSEEIAASEESAIIHKILVNYNPSGDYARDVESVFDEVRKIYSHGETIPIHIYSSSFDSGSSNTDAAEHTDLSMDKPNDETLGCTAHIDQVDEHAYVYVKTGEEFVNAIRSNRTILLTSPHVSLDDIFNTHRENVRLVESHDGISVTIRGVNNLRIAVEGNGYSKITVTSRYATVLSFDSCNLISIEGISFGHEPPGECTGGVLSFDRTSNIDIVDCDLFGCGTMGLNLRCVNEFMMRRSTVRDCNHGIMKMESSSGLRFSDVLFRNCGPYFGVDVDDCRDVTLIDCCFVENASDSDLFRVVSSSAVSVKGGYFYRNRAQSFGAIDLSGSNFSSSLNIIKASIVSDE
jgi:hypothetical protein